MNTRRTSFVLAMAVAMTAPSLALADGYYATIQLGGSQQASDSEPYGNNVAVDSDFPGAFDAGDGTVGGIGIGYKFSEQIRVEGRLAYRDSSFDDRQIGTGARAGEEYVLNGEIKSTALTVEGFFDFPNNTKLTPFVKAGLGVSDNSYDARLGGAGVAAFDAFDGNVDGFYDAYADGDSTELSWNVGLGGTFEISKRTAIYGEYQYASFGDVRTGQDAFTDGFKVDDIASHEVVLGLRVNF